MQFTPEHEWMDVNGTVGFVGISAWKLKGIKEIDDIKWRHLRGQISLRYGSAIQCQRHVQDPAAAVQLLLARRDTDAVLFIRKWLKEAIRKAGLQPPRTRFKPGAHPGSACSESLQIASECLSCALWRQL